MNIAIILGTRPEIIKMSPVLRQLDLRQAKYFILHTGQHYTYSLDRVFFEKLKLKQPKYNLEVGSGSHAEQTAKILTGVEKVLKIENPDIVLVEGDTNSVLAGALAAAKLHIKVGHIEAGLRSYDRSMPEEINRILTDHCSHYLFAPTEKAGAILRNEGILGKITVTGNTIVDAIYENLEIALGNGNNINRLHIRPKEYFLATIHREENVDDRERFASILEGLNELSTIYHLPVIYPIHPRSKKRMSEFGLEPGSVRLINPVDFFGFLEIESHAKLILTDSGGMQEEACVLGVPCVTLRENTERPETLDVGSNILAGSDPKIIVECAKTMLSKRRDWCNPFGEGKAAEKIVDILEVKS